MNLYPPRSENAPHGLRLVGAALNMVKAPWNLLYCHGTAILRHLAAPRLPRSLCPP